MANKSLNRSAKLRDDADLRYEVATPFADHDAEILLIQRDNDTVEVIVGHIPAPRGYNLEKNSSTALTEQERDCQAVAEWIVAETAKMFDDYDWKTSEYKTHNPNYHLRDIYFTCGVDEVEDAVLTAKRFITELEEQSLAHAKRFERPYSGPADQL